MGRSITGVIFKLVIPLSLFAGLLFILVASGGLLTT